MAPGQDQKWSGANISMVVDVGASRETIFPMRARRPRAPHAVRRTMRPKNAFPATCPSRCRQGDDRCGAPMGRGVLKL